jgi:hypothetical protein
MRLRPSALVATERARERLLALLVALAAASGAALGNVADRVTPIAAAARPGRYIERAVYCPPKVTGRGVEQRVGVSARGDLRATVAIEPTSRDPVALPGSAVLVDVVDERSALDVVGIGAPVSGAVTMSVAPPARGPRKSAGGAGAGNCSPVASPSWFFASGSSELTADQRLLLYNPFPDEAVVRISFFTPTGERSKANLADVAVPAGKWREIRVNDYILSQPLLATSIEANRGRIVAWRSITSTPESGPRGVGLTLGSPAPGTAWYFPEGGVGPGVRERLAVLNPGGEEARVSVSLSTSSRTVQPRRLVEVAVPPRSTAEIDLGTEVAGGSSDTVKMGAAVISTNGVPVVAERELVYSGNVEGISIEVGARGGALGWLMGPILAQPDDDWVAILNPGERSARVSLALQGGGGPVPAPARLDDLRVGAGLRIEVALPRAGGPVTAVVVSDQPVVAERASYGGGGGPDRRFGRGRPADVAGLMGVPFRPNGP